MLTLRNSYQSLSSLQHTFTPKISNKNNSRLSNIIMNDPKYITTTKYTREFFETNLSTPCFKNWVIFSDMDGTLLPSTSEKLTSGVIEGMSYFQSKGGKVVVVTGRNSHSVCEVLPREAPVDYLLFSNGAGVMDWPRQSIVQKHTLSPEKTTLASTFLASIGLEHFVHHNVPDNNKFHSTPPHILCEETDPKSTPTPSCDFLDRTQKLHKDGDNLPNILFKAKPIYKLHQELRTQSDSCQVQTLEHVHNHHNHRHTIDDIKQDLLQYFSSHSTLQHGSCQVIGVAPNTYELLHSLDDTSGISIIRPADSVELFADQLTRRFFNFLQAEYALQSQTKSESYLSMDNQVQRTKIEDYGFSIVVCTSPLDHSSVWIEILPAYVYKGATAKSLLQNILNLEIETSREGNTDASEEKNIEKNSENKEMSAIIMGIGNDYNDISLLNFTSQYGTAYLVNNAPVPMKEAYKNVYNIVDSCDNEGFCEALIHWSKNAQNNQ